jgi:hypothetical protein
MAQKWNRGQQRPMVEIYYPSYFKAETAVVASIQGEVEKLLAVNLADPK